MSGIIKARDAIRDFLRKYDEIISPLFRFVAAWLMFWSINKLYGYSDLFGRSIVTFLLSVICALVSGPVAVLIGSAVIIFSSFFVSKEIGIITFLLFMIAYFMYLRMFPDCGWIIFFVPIMYILKLNYAIPLIVAIFAGASGMVPVAIGVFLYKYSFCVKEINDMLAAAVDKKDVDVYQYLIDNVLKDKEILFVAVVSALVILITAFIYILPFNYSWYVAIGVGGLFNIMIAMLTSASMSVDVAAGELVIGTIIGMLVGVLVTVCKRLVDYSRKEIVQFEDDDYYYYVKAIPKYSSARDKKQANNKKSEDAKKPAEGTRNTRPANSTGTRKPADGAERTVREQTQRTVAGNQRKPQRPQAQSQPKKENQ